MYDREYNGNTHTLEASGGLKNASLIMRDLETDSYWEIMTGKVIGGKLKGTKMIELPYGEKMQWKDWVKRYPNTLVLSVNGSEDTKEGYVNYFDSPDGFRGYAATDNRLKTKDPIFAFHLEGTAFAVPHEEIEEGKTFKIGDQQIFLYRPKGSALFESTAAFITGDGEFSHTGEQWQAANAGCIFDESEKKFAGEENDCPQRLDGFDTFWYNWSLNNEGTELLGTK